MQLDEAYTFLTSIRPCGPQRDAIRGATFDVLAGSTGAAAAAAAAAAASNGNGNGSGHHGHHEGQHHHHGHGHGGSHGGHGHVDTFAVFDSLPKDAYATLSEDDRFALQYRVLKGLW